MPTAATPDIDRILDAIRREARARGSRAAIGSYPMIESADASGLAAPDIAHVADYLALPLDVFIVSAYRAILAREPDAAGAAHYQRMLLRGRLTRVEVLGRLCFSSEGRRRARAPRGIHASFALAMLYRVPLVGPIAGFLATLLRLPPHWQDRSSLERAALATGSWMKR